MMGCIMLSRAAIVCLCCFVINRFRDAKTRVDWRSQAVTLCYIGSISASPTARPYRRNRHAVGDAEIEARREDARGLALTGGGPANSYGLHIRGRNSDGPYGYGLYSHGLYSPWPI